MFIDRHRPISIAAAFVLLPLQLQSASTVAAQSADPGVATTLEATIVEIDGDEVLIDVGLDRVAAGTRLRVLRRIVVRHPVTKRKLSDHFVIGELTVAQPGAVMSIAHVLGTPTHAFSIGDTVEGEPVVAAPLAAPPAEVLEPPPVAANTPCAAGEAGPDTETRELLLFWKAGLARSPARRIKLYGDFLLRHPKTEHLEFVKREISYLNDIRNRLRGPASKPAAVPKEPGPKVVLSKITRASHGEPLWISLAFEVKTRPQALLLQARAIDDDRYRSLPMELHDGGYARVQLPAGLITAPGLEFFIEAIDGKGKATAVHGTADRPRRIDVSQTSAQRHADRPSTRVRFQTEVVSFDGVSGRDYFVLTQGDFLYRLRYPHLHAVRMGYGHYSGQGGTVEQLDELELEPEPAGFSYGFLEGQFPLSRLFGVAVRGTIGLGRPQDTEVPRDALAGGFQLRLRIGPRDGTQLVLAGELMQQLGQRAFVQLRFEPIEDFPMAAEVHVTDQPVNSDELAVRLIYELGVRVSDRVALALRPSYQLRTIDHAGMGLGAAVTFDW